MIKIAFRSLSLLVVCLFFQIHPAVCAEQTPEQLVRDFYAWYFKADAATEAAIENDEIYMYVSKETVGYARSPYTDGVDYFTKLGTDIDWKNTTLALGKRISMADDTYVIPVTFKGRLEDHMEDMLLIVYVKKENGSLYIYKVSNRYPYS